MKKLKALISVLNLLFTCVLLALSLTACSSGEGKHTHTPGEAVKENEIFATCTSEGSYDVVVYCSKCNEELSRTKQNSPILHNVQNGVCVDCGAKESTDGLAVKLFADLSSTDSILYYGVSGIGNSAESNIVIDLYNGSPLIHIGSSAFKDCTNLTSVTIGNSVTSIGSSAFWGCTSLTSITIPDSVMSIGENAFYDCTALNYNEYDNAYYLGNESNKYLVLIVAKSTDITSCTINENCKVIYYSAFSGCTSLTSITIPDSVTSIGGEAFRYCTSLTSVKIPNTVTSIGDSAFSGCESLTSITIPDSVTSIGSDVFSDCTALTYNEYDNAYYLGNESNKYLVLIKSKSKDITSCTVNENCKVISGSAFDGCKNLASVTIPDSVASIGEYAFSGCTSLTSVYYKGTASEWSNIQIQTNVFFNTNPYLTDATRYYYSETKPTETGNYWHYGENGEIIVW